VKVRSEGLSETQRRFLKSAAKELDRHNTTLDDALALRELAREQGVRDAYDGVLAAHGDRFGMELLLRVSPFLDAATLGALQGAAKLFDLDDAFEARLSAARLLVQKPALPKTAPAQQQDPIAQALAKIGTQEPSVVDRVRAALVNMRRDLAAQPPEVLEKIRALKLPTEGAVVFVPPKGWNVSQPQRTEDKKGFVDADGNEWRKGPSRTPGEPFEWDVVPAGNSALRHLSRDGSHVNVSLTGRVTHK
jgi:hypothetical protein